MSAQDYQKLAESLDSMREVTAAMVAGFMTDGFSEEQARIIVAGFFASLSKREEGQS